MTIGSDQLDAWGRTLIECDELYREVQLLIRINPEAYSVDSDALATVGVANSDGADDAGLLHPIVFARRWAWYLAAENRAIPPITNNWVTLIRYVAAHLQYLAPGDREWFADDLRRLRGQLGAYVNENGLAQGEAEDLQRLNARQAREELRERVTQVGLPLTREQLTVIWPELQERHWQHLRDRKKARPEGLGRGEYWPEWAASSVLSGDRDLILGGYVKDEYVDVYNLKGERIVSFEALAEAEAEADARAEW